MHRYTDRLCSDSIYNWIKKYMFKSVKPTTTVPTPHMWLNELVTIIIFNIISYITHTVCMHMRYMWMVCVFSLGCFFFHYTLPYIPCFFFSFWFRSTGMCMIKTFLSPGVIYLNSLDVYDRCKHIKRWFMLHFQYTFELKVGSWHVRRLS